MSVQWSSNHATKHSSSSSMHTFLLIVDAIGAPEAAVSFKLNQAIHDGPEITQEAEVQPAGQEEPEEEVECPNHEPASFVKGKPWSILSLPL